MTDTPAPDPAAVQIARDAWDHAPTRPGGAWLAALDALAALARAGWLIEPDRRAALEAVADAAFTARGEGYPVHPDVRKALAALDALPPADGPEPAPAQGEDVELMWVGGPCAWNEETGQHERGVGRDRDECRYCDAQLMAAPASPQPATGDDQGRER